jgi:RNA 2',3'-cyclic 3'-phosphodiesterase
MRLFIGIPLPAVLIEELWALSIRLRCDLDGLRWTSSDSWHITLQFLGETTGEQFSCGLAILRELHSPVVPIRIEGLDVFDRAGIFFAGVSVVPELLQLQQRIRAATAQCGFVPEARPFHPHITLARAKGESRSLNLRTLKSKVGPQPAFSSFVADKFLLYEAFLGSAGSRYEIRAQFSLEHP